jgi:hypothetical protein
LVLNSYNKFYIFSVYLNTDNCTNVINDDAFYGALKKKYITYKKK